MDSSPEFSGQIASQEGEGNTAKHVPLPVLSKSSQHRQHLQQYGMFATWVVVFLRILIEVGSTMRMRNPCARATPTFVQKRKQVW